MTDWTTHRAQTSRTITLLATVAVLAGLPAGSRAAEPASERAAAHPGNGTPVEAVSVVVLSRLGTGESEDAIEAVREAVVGTFIKHGVTVADDAEPSLTVLVRWKDKGAQIYGVRFAFAPTIRSTKKTIVELECACDGPTLLEQVVRRIESLLPEFVVDDVESPPEPTGAPDPSATPAGDLEPPAPRISSDVRPRKLTPLGWAGVGLVTSGGAAVVTGIALVAVGQRPDREQPSELRDYRAPGWAVLGLGAATAVVGGVLIGVDAARGNRPRQGQARRVVPTLAPVRRGVAISLVGRW